MSKIELLPVSLLETKYGTVNQFLELSRNLRIGLGWHYLLDLVWTINHLPLGKNMLVLDAGAGQGILQWWLADHGVNVISVDRHSRRGLAKRFRHKYRVKGLREIDLAPPPGLRGFLPSRSPRCWHLYPKKLASTLREYYPKSGGTVFIYNQDLQSMPHLQSASIDAAVSISSLEHNSPEELVGCVQEIMRTLKTGGKLIATLGAAKEQDWFHEPSKGWCYTEESLRKLFNLPADCPSNYDRYDDLFTELCTCAELRDNLADFYYKSGNNGMPWGIWDPKYQPVGIVKVKL